MHPHGIRAAIAITALSLPLVASAAPVTPALLFEKTIPGVSTYEVGFITGGSDLDADGRPDVLFATESGSPGTIHIYSGGRASALDEISGRGTFSYLGAYVRFAGDLDGDGVSDILAAAPGDRSAYAYSGATRGRLLLHSPLPWGGPVAGLGDIDADGVPDFLVARFFFGPDHLLATVYSGRTGTALYTVEDATSTEASITGAESLGDLDGDDVADFILGDPHRGTNSGFALICSGRTGSTIRRYDGEAGDFRGAWVHGLGDINGDGTPDYTVDRRLYSGADGAMLLQLQGRTVGLGQVDGEGGNDVATVGASGISIFDFAAGRFVGEYPFVGTNQSYIEDLQPAGDLDGDGTTDLLVAVAGDGPRRQTLLAIRNLRGAPQAASVDLLPRACPNLLADRGGAPIEFAILGVAAGDVAQIDASTLRVAGIAPIAGSARLRDVGGGSAGAGASCACRSDRPDAIDDLVVRFDADEFRAALGAIGDGVVRTLAASASSRDGRGWHGADCITGASRGHNRLASGTTTGGEPRAVKLLGSSIIGPGESVRLSYAAPAGAGASQVAVFDLAGRRVAELADGASVDGRRETSWDGKDARGARARRGVYFIQVRRADAVARSVTVVVR